MGEHAEEALDQLLFGWGSDDANGCAAYGRDYPTSIRCKRCGSGPFNWENFGTNMNPRWRLVDDDLNVHVCPPPTPKQLGFEDIT